MVTNINLLIPKATTFGTHYLPVAQYKYWSPL